MVGFELEVFIYGLCDPESNKLLDINSDIYIAVLNGCTSFFTKYKNGALKIAEIFKTVGKYCG